MQKIFFLIIPLLILSACAGSGITSKPPEIIKLPDYNPMGDEPQVAVLDFDNDSFFESEVLGPSVSTMFQTALVKSKRFKVIDRENLQQIMDEYKLGMSGITSKDISSVGQQLGVDYLISGKITEFAIKKTGTSVGGGVVDINSISGGGAKIKKEKGTARIVVDIRITDVKTGQIIFMDSSVGESYSENVNMGLALLTGSATAVGATISSGVQGFDETIAGKASRAAAYQMVNQIISENTFNWE